MTKPLMNRQYVFAARPDEQATAECFGQIETEVPAPQPGEILCRNLWLSVDPYLRLKMHDRESYTPPLQIGEAIPGSSVAQVIATADPAYQEGDLVAIQGGWQEYAIVRAKHAQRVDPALSRPESWLGALGMSGFTAYGGLLSIGQPKAGETVVVSAAAGAVGSLVGQIARQLGCRVVGIAGGPEKCARTVERFGFDACVDYRADDFPVALAAACPDGIDVYFDNVGGPVTDAIANLFNLRARMIVCGLISHYNMPDGYVGPSILRSVLTNRVLIQGMIVFDWHDRWPAGIAQLGKFVKAGKLKYKEDVTEGLENAPSTFIGMLGGRNFGKTLIKIAE